MAAKEKIFKELKKDNFIEFVFSSYMDNIDYACEKITEYLKIKIENIEPQLFPINLVIREGLTNAIRHGNRNDPHKEIRFRLTIKSGPSVSMEIEDQGDGFDWKMFQNKEPASDKDHGRGIPIMNMYFSSYSYNDKGNILYLEKELS